MNALSGLTLADVGVYRTQGFFITREPIFTDAEIDTLVRAQEAYFTNPPPWPYKKRAPDLGWNPGKNLPFKKGDFACHRMKEFMSAAKNPKLGAIAASLVGEDVYYWTDHISCKNPAPKEDAVRTAVGWHNDRHYWLACTAENMISAWIPLTDMNEASGTLYYIKGSHLWEDNYHLDFYSHDLDSLEKKINSHGNSIEKVPLNLRRGFAAFHHCKTIHGSGPNTSGGARRALAIHMQPVSNRPDPKHYHINKILGAKDGKLNFQDPDFFPLLGQAQSYSQ